MKKTKKLSAMLLASLISAGAVSSFSVSALSYTTYGGKFTQKAFENTLENCEYMVPVENELLGGCYIFPLNTRFSDLYGTPGCFEIIKLEDVRSDYIQIWSAYDIDMEKLEEAITQFLPDAVIQKYLMNYNAPEYPDLDVEREPDLHWGITIKGYEGSLPYQEAKEANISFESAEALHNAIAEIDGLESYRYIEEEINASVTFSALTSYGPFEAKGTYDSFENFITENNLDYHTFYEVFYENIIITANTEASAEEYYKVAEKIYNEMNEEPYINWSTPGPQAFLTVYDLHNNILGDANDDDQLALSDAVAILQSIGNPDDYELTPQGEYNADIAGDSDGITNLDALTVQRKLLKLE